MRKKKYLIIIFILSLFLGLGVNNVYAGFDVDGRITSPGGAGTVVSGGLPNPINAGKPAPVSWQIVIGRIIQAILGIVGSLALVMFVYGGFVWMMAAGNNEAIQKGKNVLVWATVGLIVIFSSYALVNMVFTGLGV